MALGGQVVSCHGLGCSGEVLQVVGQPEAYDGCRLRWWMEAEGREVLLEDCSAAEGRRVLVQVIE